MDKEKITEIIDRAKYQLELITRNYVKIISKSLICEGDSIIKYNSMYQITGNTEKNEKIIKEEIGKKISENVIFNKRDLEGDFIDYGKAAQIIEGRVYIIPQPSVFFDKLNNIEGALNSIKEHLDAESETTETIITPVKGDSNEL